MESIHHKHQSEILEQQMQSVFEGDVQLDAQNFKNLAAVRAYLMELRTVLDEHIRGTAALSAPTATAMHVAPPIIYPSLAPYEAAKDNGTIALLPTDRLRLYGRVSSARDLALKARDQRDRGFTTLASFQEQYVDSVGIFGIRGIVHSLDLAVLSPTELRDYSKLVAISIKDTDLVTERLQIFDIECQAILAGARDEFDLLQKISHAFSSTSEVEQIPSPTSR